jgi:cytochrome c-type biogenesis protein CcsB
MEIFFLNTSFAFLFIDLITKVLSFSTENFLCLDFCNKEQKSFFVDWKRVFLPLSGSFLVSTLVIRRVKSGHFPVSTLYESLVFLSLIFVFFSLIFLKADFSWFLIDPQYMGKQDSFQKLISLVLSLFPIFTLGFASFCLPIDLQKGRSLVPALKSNWLFIHVTVILISYGGLLLRSSLSIIFLLIDFSVSANKSLFTSFIGKLDVISYRLILFSYPFLTLGIISGAVWANETWGSYWNWDPKETWSLIIWFVFAVYFHQRLLANRKSKELAFLATFGFVRIWFSYLGVNLMGKGLHSYGWFF